MLHFVLTAVLGERCCSRPHFTDAETEAQREVESLAEDRTAGAAGVCSRAVGPWSPHCVHLRLSFDFSSGDAFSQTFRIRLDL